MSVMVIVIYDFIGPNDVWVVNGQRFDVVGQVDGQPSGLTLGFI